MKESEIAIQYFKLHGSLRWRHHQNGDFEKTTVQELPDSHTGATPMVIYPGDKSAEGQPWRTMFDWFEKRLLEADAVVMIGCSLRDDLVNSRIQTAMKTNERLHLYLMKRTDIDANETHKHGGLQVPVWEREGRMVQIRHTFGTTEAIDALREVFSQRWSAT